jgi:hypothetical protein
MTLVIGFVAGVLSTLFAVGLAACLGTVWGRRVDVTAYRGALRPADRPARRL